MKRLLLTIFILSLTLLLACGPSNAVTPADSEVAELERQTASLQGELEAKEASLEELQTQNRQNAAEIETLKVEISQKTERITELEQQVDDQAKQITMLGEASKKSASKTEPKPESPEYQLQLLAMSDETAYGYITISGQVKNISNESLKNVEAIVQFYTADDKFVKSDSALIEYNPILPGQTSPFEVLTTENPDIKKYSVSFKFLFGGTISTEDKR